MPEDVNHEDAIFCAWGTAQEAREARQIAEEARGEVDGLKAACQIAETHAQTAHAGAHALI